MDEQLVGAIPRRRRWARTGTAIGGSVLACLQLAGCSLTPGGDDRQFVTAAEEVIEGDLAGQIGFGPLDADCGDLDGAELVAGDSFPCSGVDEAGRVIRFEATIEAGEGAVVVRSVNLILARQVEAIEAAAAQQVMGETGVAVSAEDVDCGSTSILAVDGDTLDCRVRDPSDGTYYEAPVALHSVESMVIDISIGDPIN